ncbi:hypothetical protein [Paraburkholderia sp. D1E]|uniref:hypothetical protein n=1 Tax=Paraburkholderia sp. D1E TaxID=3461398 RepID=UPI004046093A
MVVRVVFGFYDVVVKWGNVLFFAFYTMWLRVGFFWRCVEECDFGPAGLGFVVFFVIWFGFYIWVWLFDLWINGVNGLLVLPLCGANANRPITKQGKAKKPDQGKTKTAGKQTNRQTKRRAGKKTSQTKTPINQTKRNSGFPLPCRAKNNKP